MGQNNNRINWQTKFRVEPAKVVKHPLWHPGGILRLSFAVDQKARIRTAEYAVRQDIHFVPLARRHIGEDFFVEESTRLCGQVTRQIRKEDYDELPKECGDEV